MASRLTACEKEGESLALLGHGRREMLIAVIARHCLSHAQRVRVIALAEWRGLQSGCPTGYSTGLDVVQQH